jgi:hypothetical protein
MKAALASILQYIFRPEKMTTQVLKITDALFKKLVGSVQEINLSNVIKQQKRLTFLCCFSFAVVETGSSTTKSIVTHEKKDYKREEREIATS